MALAEENSTNYDVIIENFVHSLWIIFVFCICCASFIQHKKVVDSRFFSVFLRHFSRKLCQPSSEGVEFCPVPTASEAKVRTTIGSLCTTENSRCFHSLTIFSVFRFAGRKRHSRFRHLFLGKVHLGKEVEGCVPIMFDKCQSCCLPSPKTFAAPNPFGLAQDKKVRVW